MDREHFILFLQSVLEGTVSTETHALLYVSMTQARDSAYFSRLILNLRDQVGPDIQYADLKDANYIVFLHRVTIEEAMRTARQLRYSMEHPSPTNDKLAASFGVVLFDYTKTDIEDLLIVAQQTSLVAQSGGANRIEPFEYTATIGL